MAKQLGWFVVAGADLSDYTEQEKINLLGGKGAGLQFMKANGINVPPFLTIPTDAYQQYAEDPKGTMKVIKDQLDPICNYFIDHFGYMPLLSVRSGARASMPGMMDTVLNVGLDAKTYGFWEKKLGGKCVENCYDRLHEMYGETVLGLKRGVKPDLPTTKTQLLKCIEAVFKSWNSERAKIYRKLHNIPEDWGTAVTVQAMVFGNFNEQSCSGVLFTRNPDTGLAKITGEFLPNAQGEDVVAGTVTPLSLDDMTNWNHEVHSELIKTVIKLEELKRDVQDVEFTVQDGKLYILQTRNAKRSAMAAIKIAMDMHIEGVLSVDDVIERIKARDFDLAQLPIIDPKSKKKPMFTGIPACSGVATGKVVFSAQAAIDCTEPCILVTQETTPDDIGGMIAAKGVLTMTGGATSHAAVVARGMNKPCVVGLGQIIQDTFVAGKVISIDGATGRVFDGEVKLIEAADSWAVNALLELLWGKAGARKIDGKGASYVTVGDTVLLPDAERLKVIIERLSQTEGLVYLDLTEESMSPMEKNYFDCFQKEPKKSLFSKGGDFNEFLLEEIKSKYPQLVERVTLVGVEAKGFKGLSMVSNLSQLIMAEGEATCSGSLAALVGQDVMAKVLKLKGTEVSFLSVGEVREGTKSFISEPQLIASFLK
jgi:phosphoenolpyruvate synthase/pyruvate phosphate dikinase